jgi:hypothetical protein
MPLWYMVYLISCIYDNDIWAYGHMTYDTFQWLEHSKRAGVAVREWGISNTTLEQVWCCVCVCVYLYMCVCVHVCATVLLCSYPLTTFHPHNPPKHYVGAGLFNALRAEQRGQLHW